MYGKFRSATVHLDCCVVAAEIGQNHQGQIEIAKDMIKAAAAAGADCVKFQKSTVLERFNKKCLAR